MMHLNAIAEIEMGTSPPGSSYNTHGDGDPLLNGPTEFGPKCPSAVQWTTSATKYCKAGDVLFCVRGSSTGRMNVADRRYAIGRGLAAIRAKSNKADTRFIQFALEFGVNSVLSLSAGSTFPSLDKKAIGEFTVGDFSVAEQCRIAAILSTWDRAIELTEKLIAAKQKRKAALMQQLLTGKVRLPGFTGDWTTSRIGRFLTESRLAGSAGDTARKLTVKLYGKGVISKVDIRPGSAETKYFRRRAGQFIYSKLDFLNGAFGIIPDALDGYESTLDLPAFDMSADADPRWFFYFVTRESFYKTGLSLANGGRKARRVNPADFLKSEIPFPHFQEQQAIAAVIETAVLEISLHIRKLEALRRQKKGLMQQLLTGKVRVNGSAGSEG